MSWGRKLLDDDAFAEQEETLAKAANPWGPLLGLPSDAPVVDPARVEAALASVDGDDDTVVVPPIGDPEVGQVTVEKLRIELAASPALWATYLPLELERANPRKTALQALLEAMENEGVSPDTLQDVHTMLEAL